MFFTALALAAGTASKLLLASKILIAAGSCMTAVGPAVERLQREQNR